MNKKVTVYYSTLNGPAQISLELPPGAYNITVAMPSQNADDRHSIINGLRISHDDALIAIKALAKTRLIPAIKLYRAIFGGDLLEAKEAIHKIKENGRFAK